MSHSSAALHYTVSYTILYKAGVLNMRPAGRSWLAELLYLTHQATSKPQKLGGKAREKQPAAEPRALRSWWTWQSGAGRGLRIDTAPVSLHHFVSPIALPPQLPDLTACPGAKN